MVEISVLSRAHRAFRDTTRFHFLGNEPGAAAQYEELVRSGEALRDAIGIYKNPDKVEPEAILVAEAGLILIRPGSVQRIEFADIESIQSPSAEDESPDISVRLRSGIVVRLRVAGKDGRFRDVFNFVRFLDRVLEDRR
jgi:hypothetical protein